MSIHYFLVGLKPIVLGEPAPMSSLDFIRRAQDVFDGYLLQDLERVFAYHDVELSIQQGSLAWDTLWWNYWSSIKHEAHSSFLKHLAHKALCLYAAVAHELYRHESLGPMAEECLDNNDTLDWPCAERLKKILNQPHPYFLERELIDYFMCEIDESIGFDNFSSDQIFSYFYKLVMCERFNSFCLLSNDLVLAQFTAPLIERALYEQKLSS